MTEKKLQQLVERDIMQLKLLLKLRMVGYSEIREKEREHIHHFHTTLLSVKDIENHLRKELQLINTLRKKAEKTHRMKRWNIVHATLKRELQEFHRALEQRKNLVAASQHLSHRLQTFFTLLKTAQRKTLKGEEGLRILRTFRQEP